ncbi:MAG: class I SAM-dependent methyltransferase [Gammaproteobacteria bacterium]
MKDKLVELFRNPKYAAIKRASFWLRGLLFRGSRYTCPCCDSKLRGFVGREGLLKRNNDGYCPRCNAKARHRRIWLYLKENTNLGKASLRLLEVAPWWSLARKFSVLDTVDYAGLDLKHHSPFVNVVGNISNTPLQTDSFDAALCIHVLEHVDDDANAMRELYRVLKPGGWVLVSVPLLLDEGTREDPSVTDPQERKRLFGETGHVRFYGTDFIERLKFAGFQVTMNPASTVSADTRLRYGLRDDENIFHCVKPA